MGDVGRYSLRFGRCFGSFLLVKDRFCFIVVFLLFIGGTTPILANAAGSLVIKPSSWAVIGPFDNPKDTEGDPVYPPEYEIRLDTSYGSTGKWGRRVYWQRFSWVKEMEESLNFARLYPDGNGIAYAFTTLHSVKRREVLFKLEGGNRVQVWVNGRQILDHTTGADFLRTAVGLERGWNQILVKTYSGNEQWRFLMKIEPKHEEPLTDVLCELPYKIHGANKAALFSLLLPGPGHIYLGDVEEGLLLLGVETALLFSSILFDLYAFDNLLNDEEENSFRNFFSNPPLVAAVELPLLSGYLAYRRAREKNHNIGYKQPLPDESVMDLAKAPFDLSIIAKPDFFLPFIFHFGAVLLLQSAIFPDSGGTSSDQRAGDGVHVYGTHLPSSIGYPLGEAGLWLSCTAVSMGEEALFRGYLQSELEERFGKRLGWLSASALFGALHIPNGTTTKERMFASLSAFTGGLVMGYFYQKEGYSLRKSIAYHTWWNFSLTTINFLQNPKDSIISGNIVFRF